MSYSLATSYFMATTLYLSSFVKEDEDEEGGEKDLLSTLINILTGTLHPFKAVPQKKTIL